MSQEGDVLLYQTVDNGDVIVENGLIRMTGSFETAVYLSLFGGNEDDDGRADNAFNWWGNIDEVDTANQLRSETQNLLQSIPATSGNLLKIEDAASRDLKWFIDKKIASSVEVTATIPAINKILITIVIVAEGIESNFEFVENWKASL